jgi:hypothetical protein
MTHTILVAAEPPGCDASRGSRRVWRITRLKSLLGSPWLRHGSGHNMYLGLDLRAHELLRGIPLYDVTVVDLPGGGAGRSLADVRQLDRSATPSRIAAVLFGVRRLLGRVFGWDRSQMRAEDSLVSRMPERHHGARLDLDGVGSHCDGVPAVLGGLRAPGFLDHATVSDADRAVPPSAVSGHAASDSASLGRHL